MKKILALLLVLPCLVFAELEWKKTTINYSAKPEDESVTALYHFTNTGAKTVQILQTRTSCGCTVANLEKDSYAPGETGIVKVKFTFDGRAGHEEKQIEVFTDDSAHMNYILNLNVDIPETLEVSPQMLSWAKDGKPVTKTAIVDILTPNPVKITSADSESDNFVVELSPLEEGRRYRISVTPKKTDYNIESKLKLTTNVGKENPKLAFVILKIY